MSFRLRSPSEKLADTCWLPRFVDKARRFLANELSPEYAGRFCNPRAMDGLFLAHFVIGQEEFMEAVRASDGNDGQVADWFRAQAGVTNESVSNWNREAPKIGAVGQRGHEIFRKLVTERYPDVPYTGVESAFAVIEADEGRNAQNPA